MLNFLRIFYERPYTSGQVELALNFLLDSQRLLGVKGSPNLDERGFKGCIHDGMNKGITNPLVLKYVGRRFKEFYKITSVCDTIVKEIVEYDGARGYWAGNVSVSCDGDYIQKIKRGNVTPPEYLARFIPLDDIVSGLSGPCPWSTEQDGSIKPPTI